MTVTSRSQVNSILVIHALRTHTHRTKVPPQAARCLRGGRPPPAPRPQPAAKRRTLLARTPAGDLRSESDELRGQWGLERDVLTRGRMPEADPGRVERLPRRFRPFGLVASRHVEALAIERVASELTVEPDLVAPPRDEPHLEDGAVW